MTDQTCYNCRYSFVASSAGDFIGDEPDEGTTCWYACRKGREIGDGKGCEEWEGKE